MKKKTILAEIEQRDDLLSLPQALAEILRQVDNPDFGSDQLAQIILKDPPLTGKVLKLANSPAYQRYGRVSNVHKAVQTLGSTTVKCLALSSSILHPDRIEKETGIDSRRYFENILTVAAASEKIAEAMQFKSTEEAFIAGLLHDIGTMFFLHHYPDEYRKVIKAAGAAHDPCELERAEFGIDHCEVGHLLATRWRLPKPVALAIQWHHTEAAEAPADPIVGIVRLATLMVSRSLIGHAVDLETRLPAVGRVGEALGLTRDQINEVSTSLLPATVAVAQYLEIDIGSTEEILERANAEVWRAYFMIESLFRDRQELTRKLLEQEHARGAFESKNIALATLSHYVNNAAMAIYGRSQMVRLRLDQSKHDAVLKMLPECLDTIDQAVRKTVAVLAEMKDISPIDEVEFLSTSKALNLDDRIEHRMAQMAGETGESLEKAASKAAPEPVSS